MSFVFAAEKLPLPTQAWNADIPELFGVPGGQGYGYVSETRTLRLSAKLAHQRAGVDGINLCADLVLIDHDSMVVSHAVESQEGIHEVPFGDYPYAVIVQGARGYAGPRLARDMGAFGFKGELTTVTVPNHRYGFAMFVNLEGPRLAVAQRDAEPVIQWYDIRIPS